MLNTICYTWIEKRTQPVISTLILKLKDFSRSQAVMYTVKVIRARKRCKTATLLPQTS